MQTFITDFDMAKSAANLDNKRLGKQRVEALQIAEVLLCGKQGWKNHPAVKMWKGYEYFLVDTYIFFIMNEWTFRGFKNTKCYEKWKQLCFYINPINYKYPEFITEDFITAHRSNLIRKNPEYYHPKWPDVPNNLDYIWPVK